jgi:hypothetical protein
MPGLKTIQRHFYLKGRLGTLQEAAYYGDHGFLVIYDEHPYTGIVEIFVNGNLVLAQEANEIIAADTAMSARRLEHMNTPRLCPFPNRICRNVTVLCDL